eukprot:7356332-Prymnesium_polylepis.1
MPQLLLLAATGMQFGRALQPSAVPVALEAPPSRSESAASLAPPAQPEPQGSLQVLVNLPFIQVTILSAEAPALPLLQLGLGDEDAPITLTADKPDARTP